MDYNLLAYFPEYIQNLKTVVDSLIIDDDHDENDTSGEDMLGPTKNKYTEARESAEQLVKSMHIEDIDAERLAISNKIKVFVQERGNMLDMTKEMLDEFMNNDDNQDTGKNISQLKRVQFRYDFTFKYYTLMFRLRKRG